MEKNERIKIFQSKYGHVISEDLTNWLEEKGYFDAPASSRFHGAYNGGLFQHCMNVTDTLLDYTEKLNLQWERPESPYYVGLFHDLCKMNEYQQESLGYSRKKSNELDLTGHGDKSVMILCQKAILTEEEMMCIRYHMGAYNHQDWEQYDLAIKKYPNVLYTHTADMIASKLLDDKNKKTITYLELIRNFSDDDTFMNYEDYRQHWINQGYVIVEEPNNV